MHYVDSSTSTFSAQVTDSLPGPPLSKITTIEGYSEWMAGVVAKFGSKATFKVLASGIAENQYAFYATFMNYSDYAYVLDFNPQSCKIIHMTKIWNDGFADANMPHESAGYRRQLQKIKTKQNNQMCSSSDLLTNAQNFFDACETGKGWTGTSQYVSSAASIFTVEVTDSLPGPPPLSKVTTVQGYTDWMAGVVKEFGPKATYQVKARVSSSNQVLFYAVF